MYNWVIGLGALSFSERIACVCMSKRANANSVNATNPWFQRGGNSGNTTNAGVESINNTNGGGNANNGFRGVVVLLPCSLEVSESTCFMVLHRSTLSLTLKDMDLDVVMQGLKRGHC